MLLLQQMVQQLLLLHLLGPCLVAGDIILLDNFTTITNSNYSASDFDDKKFMVHLYPTSTT